jgi:hypothetical protein
MALDRLKKKTPHSCLSPKSEELFFLGNDVTLEGNKVLNSLQSRRKGTKRSQRQNLVLIKN